MRLRRQRTTLTKSLSDATRGDLSPVLAASHAVNSALGIQEALKVVLSSAKQLLAANEGSVMLLGSDGFLRVLASEGIPVDIAREVKIPLGEGVSGRVAHSGVPLLIGPQARELGSRVSSERRIHSAISVPLKAAGLTVGVLNLNITAEPRVFQEDDLRVAQLFGDQAAMAIHKAQLLEEAQKRSADLALLFDASRELIGVLEVEPLLTRVLDGATKLAPSRSGFVCLLDGQKLTLGIYRGIARHEIRKVLTDPAFVELFGGQVISVAEATGHSIFKHISQPSDFVSMVPMRAEGRARALLILMGPRPDDNQVRLLQTFAAQAGLAIRNAQLYRQVDEKETELASIVYSMPNPVVVVDNSGNVVAANPAAEDLFVFSTQFVKGRPVRGVLGIADLEGLLSGDVEGTIEVSIGHPTPRIFKARAAQISTPETGRRGRVLVLDDVTAEREFENLKSDFVAVIGHELRTPLTSIKGFVKTLLRRGDSLSTEQRSQALQTIESQSQRLERLIEDLLYMSRIESARDPLRLETVDIVDVVSSLIEEFRAIQLRRSIGLTGPASLKLVFDRTKVEQVLYHLLDNACKYSDEDASVKVELDEFDEEVEVRVIDKGIGILSGDLPHIFERFRQVDPTSTRRHGGTGIGLYISKRFVEGHGGTIGADSGWGKGSTFWFRLPKGLASGDL